jgi:hypothetical protein
VPVTQQAQFHNCTIATQCITNVTNQTPSHFPAQPRGRYTTSSFQQNFGSALLKQSGNSSRTHYSKQRLLHGRHAQLVEAMRYKPEGRGIDSRWFQWNISLT